MAMKKTLRFAAIVSGLVAAMSLLSVTPAVAQALGSNGATLADEVVAVVNNDVITGRELDQRVDLIARRLRQQKAPVPPIDELRMQVLNQMVLERIQVQKAKEDGIVVDDAMVQATLQRLAAANNMSLDQYRARLEAEGVPWNIFVSDARTELMLSRLREKEVDSKITVSDAEVASYIASQRGPNAGSQQDLRLEHIFVAAPQNAPETQIDAARKKAEGLLKQALAPGADFERLAKNNSEAKDAKSGGDLGFKPPGSLPADVVQAVAQLRPGQVNPALIRVPDGFEIVRLVDRRPAQGTSAASPKIVQTHVRHILLRVGEGKSEAQARQQLIDIRNKVEAGGDFASFARTYSQDGSASQGGDLGWISPGETVPEFERAMNSLQDGQISNPVRTEYGYHLIQVLGRRDAEGSIQQQMDIARQAIGQRKAEQAYADWLRELRDSSYVQIKIGQPQP
ncbi:molecular chaperone SurA [Burkholderia glumae]|nr:molecular chaperone SurA [Burkholderia glumae AU6208]PNL00462.1 molecular chaperone SurA [Burkholderia glumae]QGA36650.1 molecular chaperone SurA [Burkholderia glumae]QHE10945.1 molecular chaperone SurA [Burkholderia glumae AU6208]QHP90939.1 molecular chaperone SurA [Burkholderia glumae]